MVEPKATAADFLRPELPDAALYGLPGRVVRALEPTTESDPAALLLTFICFYGNAVGPSPYVLFGGTQHQANLFVLIAGDPASRKGTSLSAISKLFAQATPEWSAMRKLLGAQSGEAVIAAIQPKADEPVIDPRLILVEDEAKRMFQAISATSLGPVLRTAWGGGSLQVKSVKKELRADNTHVSLVGHAVPAELTAGARNAIVSAGGLETRFLWALVTRSKRVNPLTKSQADLGELAEDIQASLIAAKTAAFRAQPVWWQALCDMKGVTPPQEFPVSQEVVDKWFYLVTDRLPEPSDPALEAVFQRAEAQIIRLALVYALSSGDTMIESQHIDAALALWTYCARSFEAIATVPYAKQAPKINTERMAKLVNYLVANQTRWVSASEVYVECFARNYKAADIKGMLAALNGEEVDGVDTDALVAEIDEVVAQLGNRRLDCRKTTKPGAFKPTTEYKLIPRPI